MTRVREELRPQTKETRVRETSGLMGVTISYEVIYCVYFIKTRMDQTVPELRSCFDDLTLFGISVVVDDVVTEL